MTRCTLFTAIATLALGTSLALAPTPVAAEEAKGFFPSWNHSIAGTWRLMGNPEPTCGVMPFVNFTTITRGGKLINADPEVGTGLGEVRRVSHSKYEANFQGFISSGGPTLVYRVEGELILQNFHHFTGTFTADVADLSGNVLCSYGGTIAADRI